LALTQVKRSNGRGDALVSAIEGMTPAERNRDDDVEVLDTSRPGFKELRNRGSLAAAPTLESAVEAVEEIEETARLYLLLEGSAPTYLTEEAATELRHRFPSDRVDRPRGRRRPGMGIAPTRPAAGSFSCPAPVAVGPPSGRIFDHRHRGHRGAHAGRLPFGPSK
jgi:hypothetical protein